MRELNLKIKGVHLLSKYISFCLILACFPSFSDSYFPSENPSFRINEALSVVQKLFQLEGDDPFSAPYVERAWLINDGEGDAWLFSVAFPKEGYRFYEVTKTGGAKHLKGDHLKKRLILIGLK